jgi:hypothetical protein
MVAAQLIRIIHIKIRFRHTNDKKRDKSIQLHTIYAAFIALSGARRAKGELNEINLHN